MATQKHWEQDKDSTLYVGNLDEKVTHALVYELMLQCGPVVNVHLPKDRVSQNHQGYGFVEMNSEIDADYTVKIMNGVRLFGKPIRVNKASADKRPQAEGGTASDSIGAELFVGGLDTMVDERTLYDTFSRFGPLLAPPKITRDENGLSKGYGFVSYASFQASDDAIENMHGQHLLNKEITVQYAFKKDGQGRHGDEAERALAATAIKNGVQVAVPAMPAALTMPQQVAAPVLPQQMPGMMPGYGGYVGYQGYNGPQGGMPGAPAQYSYNPSPMQQMPPAAPPGGFGLPAGMPPPFGQFPGAPGGPPNQSSNQAPRQPPRQFTPKPLPLPGTEGLPPRPPAANAGYGGPPGLAPGARNAGPPGS